MTQPMQIKVLFFAALREQLGCGEIGIALSAPATIRDVWEKAVPEQALPEHILVARNQTYSQLEDSVEQGDEIAFFPPVTGG